MNRCAVLIATKDGGGVIGRTVGFAAPQADVFVVSDGSSDDTADVARQAGARVLEMPVNVGKPTALRSAWSHFHLVDRYEFVCVVDDDTRLSHDYIARTCRRFDDPKVVAVAGETRTDWTALPKFNGWVAGRAMGYWRYGLMTKRGQSALRVVTVLPGSNTVFRTDVFDGLVWRKVRYIVDDTQWLLDIQTEKLGRVLYEPQAKAYVQDPTTLRQYWKQYMRWIWGTFQGVRGHRIGRSKGWFSISYSLMLFDWLLYVFFWPLVLAWAFTHHPPDVVGAFYLGGYYLWMSLGAIAERQWRMVFLTPWLIAMDWINRAIFIGAFFKAWRHPTVDRCVWESPTRIETREEVAA